MIILTIAGLTLQEAARRKVLRSLAVLTALLLGLAGWGFSRIDAEFGGLTSGEAQLATAAVLNLVMFGLSLIAALGTAFLAGPTLAGDIESGTALAMLARPVRRASVLAGKWLGLVVFGGGFVLLSGLTLLIIVRVTTGYWPPRPATGLALLATQTVVLLTLGLLLSTAISPMASGIVAVGLFGATWVAGVVGGIGDALNNDSVAQIGTVSRMLLPTDGLWRGAMSAFQDPTLLFQFSEAFEGHPFLSDTRLSATYIGWTCVWIALVLGLAGVSFQRRDL